MYRTRPPVFALSIVLLLGPAISSAPGSATRGGRPVVSLSPAVARPGQQAMVRVQAATFGSLQVRLAGATTAGGARFGWHTLARTVAGRVGPLPRPALPGVYPIELRFRGGPRVLRSREWLFRVLAPGTLSRPSFTKAEAVVSWYVRGIPRARLVAVRRWPRPAFDRRDPSLHRLYVIAYAIGGNTDVSARLGAFITTFRNTYHGRWRLLEATITP